MPTITTKHTPPRLTRPQSKLRQTQSELTVNLILRLHAPSAASPEEVWGIGLLHKDPLQWTCSGSRMRFSSQHKWNKRERMWKRCSWCSSSPCGSLAVPVLLGTAAESASGDTGSEDKTWRLKIRTEKLGSHAYLSMKYNQTKKKKPYQHSVPLQQYPWLTGKCKKHSEESQEGCIRPGHLYLCVWIVERYE